MRTTIYHGRFAPSPTGPLHYGSLLTAVASYLQARSNHGVWTVRIENIDPSREPKGCIQDILDTLRDYGFIWDGKPYIQIERIHYHLRIAEYLVQQGHAFRCQCSRKTLSMSAQTGAMGPLYPGTCRHLQLSPDQTHVIRVITDHTRLSFLDRNYGWQSYDMARESGDFVIVRADKLPSYILAATLDDIQQGYTEIVRGQDLLAITARQLYLSALLDKPRCAFLHIPIITNDQGEKLSKQTHAPALCKWHARHMLLQVLEDLGQSPPQRLRWSSLNALWSWAITHWDANRIPNCPTITYRD